MEDWILDLCSGLGGASEAFAVDPHWTVIRIENNPELQHVPFTFSYDVLEWMDWLPHLISSRGRPTIIWASAPCLEFSTAYNAPGSIANREGIFFQPDMSILEAIIDIIQYAAPRYSIIENVNGASPHFLPYLGRHKQKIGPFLLWGDFPKLYLQSNFNPHKADNDPGHRDPLRANKRALVPLPISEAVLDAVCAQSKLSDWI